MLTELENKRVVIYAAGNDGRSLCRALKAVGIIPLFFIDINADKIGEVDGIVVYKPSEIPYLPASHSVVFIALGNMCFYENAHQTLLQHGFSDIRNGLDFIYESNKLICMNHIESGDEQINAANCFSCLTKFQNCQIFCSSVKRRTPALPDKLEIPLMALMTTTRCCHRCKDCLVSVPYIKQMDFDIDILLRDVDAFLQHVNYLYVLALGGGELFLHKQLPELLERLLCYDKIGAIQMATTGCVLPSEKLLQIMDNPRICISISSYGDALPKSANKKTDQFIEQLTKRNKPFRLNKSIVWYDLGDACLRQRTESEHKAIFNSCEIRKHCNIIWNSKLYFCPRTYTHNTMGILPTGSNDYVDLNTIDGLECRIRAFYNQDFISTCRYCNGTDSCPEVRAGIQLT